MVADPTLRGKTGHDPLSSHRLLADERQLGDALHLLAFRKPTRAAPDRSCEHPKASRQPQQSCALLMQLLAPLAVRLQMQCAAIGSAARTPGNSTRFAARLPWSSAHWESAPQCRSKALFAERPCHTYV